MFARVRAEYVGALCEYHGQFEALIHRLDCTGRGETWYINCASQDWSVYHLHAM